MNPEFFKKHKLDEDSLKKYWTSEGENKDRKRLKDLIAGRLKDGIDCGLRDHKIYWAVDLAYDTPFAQTSYTLVKHILSKRHKDTKEVYDALHKWGLNMDEVIRETVDASGNKRAVINIPALYKLLIPLVKAYTTIRQAKLFNDRNLNPLFRYEPVRFTLKNRMVGEVITDVIHRVSSEYGYAQILRQAILQTLRYGICLMFPQEEWYSEKRLDDDGKEAIVREGLRYNMPHPTRMAYDLSHRLSTVNTDSGTTWALYWQIETFANLKNNGKYWNIDSVPYGRDVTKVNEYKAYFEEIYPCTMGFPSPHEPNTGAGESDREKKLQIYESADEDKAVMKTEYFMKLVPKDYGMGDYPYPIWFRFVVASDDTVLYCAALPYCPINFFGYDFDDMRSRNAGLGLEILPFEDALGNVLSQWILSVKQNLSRAVFYDTNQVDGEVVENIENLGQRRFQGVPFIPFDSRKFKVAGVSPKDAFVPISFPEHNTEQIAALLNAVLAILERVLVLSSQEIGQASSHEQTAEETRVISANTSTRVIFTGTFIDDGIDAWKRQIYRAARAYMDDDISTQVSLDVPEAKEVLKELGFEIEGEKEVDQLVDAKIKVPIKAKMSMLDLDAFINTTRDGEERINNANIAAAGMQLLQVALNNPITAQAIGKQQALDLITQFGILAGLPRDFKLRVAKESESQPMPGQEGQEMEGVKELLLQASQEIQQSVLKTVNDQIAEPVADQLAQMQAKDTEQDEMLSGIMDGMAQLKKSLDGLAQITVTHIQETPPPPPPINDIGNPAPPVLP